MRHELVQRRIEQADRHRQAVECLHGRLDVLLDKHRKFFERRFPFLDGLAHDHLAEQEQRLVAAFAVEHVLGAEQADALGAELHCLRRIFGRIGIGPYFQHAHLVAELHEFSVYQVVFEVYVDERE